eukprot:scaffold150889_cov39-Tisochrysis_lutea.AAC.1
MGSQDFLQTVIQSAATHDAQIFTLSSPPHRIVHINAAWTKLCGSAAETVGQPCRIMQGLGAEPDMVRQLQAGLREQRLVRVRLTTYGSSGLPFVAEFTVTPLTDEMGNVSHLVGTLKRRSEMMSSQHVAGTSSSLADRAVAAALLAHPSMARPASSAAPAASHMGMDPLATQSGEGMQEEDRQPKLPQPSGSSQDPLLSRDFTLYTLNNHPIAPVLLRMLQVRMHYIAPPPHTERKAAERSPGLKRAVCVTEANLTGPPPFIICAGQYVGRPKICHVRQRGEDRLFT